MNRTLPLLAATCAAVVAFAAPSAALAADYPHEITIAPVAVSTLDRAAVIAELRHERAEHPGHVVGEAGTVAMAMTRHAGKTRAQVRAEFLLAQRLGLVAHGESYPQPTEAPSQQIRLAGERALAVPMASL